MRFRIVASLCTLVSAGSAGAAEMPTGYFRGNLVAWEGTSAAGVISVLDKNDEVYTCRYDSKSFIEIDHWHVKVDKLQKGDPVTVLAHRKIGESTCYVLSLIVDDPPPKPIPQIPGRRPAPPKPAKAAVIRHGRENVAGVVTQISPTSVTLRTRDGERIFQLLPDTRYYGNGLKMDFSDVAVNQRLSIETSQTQAGQWEAFQLTWGDLTVR